MNRLEDYREVAPPGAVDILLRLAERARGRRVLHVTAGRFGGGPAEMLATAVPLLNDLGLDVRWEIVGGDPLFYATTTALRAALEGAERVLDDEGLAHWVEMARLNAKKLALEADLVVVHDVTPAPLVAHRRDGRWVWHCHFDASRAQRRAWSYVRQFLNQYDAAVFSLPEFGRRLGVPTYVIHPAIDPLSEKNRELSPREVAALTGALGVPADRPMLLQVGPFNRSHDPLGVVNAYRLVRKHYDIQLVLAGTAGDDREGQEVLADLRQAAQRDPSIIVLELPPEAHRQINALQRAATLVLQKSLQDGFNLGPAEALWKGKPVIAGVAGGLPQQVIHEVTGYTVQSVEGAAFRIRHLLNNPELIARMGAAGREHVRRGFLSTHHLMEFLALLVHLTR
ncbi:MAG TPA: glycosyltransferase [Candidatus Binatia bacterium]|nr:glycosyltransferase [Candidatus Binatia bacterium]